MVTFGSWFMVNDPIMVKDSWFKVNGQLMVNGSWFKINELLDGREEKLF